MHDPKLLEQFIQLRVQGFSVPKISQQIGVPASTLYVWNERARSRILKLRLLSLEEVEDRILGAQPAQFESLATYLKAVDTELATRIANRDARDLSLRQLFLVSASLRRHLDYLKAHVTPRLPNAPFEHADLDQEAENEAEAWPFPPNPKWFAPKKHLARPHLLESETEPRFRPSPLKSEHESELRPTLTFEI